MAMDYNSTRSFTMTLAHRAVGDICRGGFRQLRNYVDMCATLAKKQQQKDFFAYAQKALQRTDSCYYSLIHRLLDSVDEDRICTVGVNMGFGGLIYGASELKKQADHGYMMDVENRRLKEELSTAKKEAVRWSNKYHDLWYDVKPYLDALHRAPELVRGFLEKILAPKQERTMNVPQQNRKRGQDVEL